VTAPTSAEPGHSGGDAVRVGVIGTATGMRRGFGSRLLRFGFDFTHAG
jgi:hypothetical protein